MSGPVYSFVRLFLATLYPAYYSFKAVKNKNVKEYVKWMMYWIIYAFYIALESVLDPFLTFWLPFYCEVKMVLLLYLVAPATRGSGVVYRRWLHPFLCDKEEEIDAVLQRVKEQGTNTALSWVHQGAQWLGRALVTTAVRGGGGLMQQLKRSYSLTDLGEQFDRDRFTEVTEEEEGGYFSPGVRRRQLRAGYPNHPLMARSPDRYLSNESLSSGYNTDFFPGPGGEPLDTGDYEMWSPGRLPSSPTPPPPRLPSPPLSSSAPPLSSPVFSPIYAPRQKAKGRNRPQQAPVSDEDEDTFYDSETVPLPLSAGQLASPASSCCPSDLESVQGDSEAEEAWGGRTPTRESIYYNPSMSEGEVTPTRCPSPLPHPPLRKARDPSAGPHRKVRGEENKKKEQLEVEEATQIGNKPARVEHRLEEKDNVTTEMATPNDRTASDVTKELVLEEEEQNRNIELEKAIREEREKEAKLNQERKLVKERKERERIEQERLNTIEKEKKQLQKEAEEEQAREKERKLIVERAKQEAEKERKFNVERAKQDAEKERVKSQEYFEDEDPDRKGDTEFVKVKTVVKANINELTQVNETTKIHQAGDTLGAQEDVSSHIYEDIDNFSPLHQANKLQIQQLEEASRDDDVNPFGQCDDDDTTTETSDDVTVVARPRSAKKSRAPLPPGGVSAAPSCSSLVAPEERIRHLTPVRTDQEEEEEEGKVFYRSPGYPAPKSRTVVQISSPDPPIQEKISPFSQPENDDRRARMRREEIRSPSPTRIFTSSGGITRLRTYSPPPLEDSTTPLPSSPLPPRSELLGSSTRSPEGASRCPHCTIHAWLPHSPSCANKNPK